MPGRSARLTCCNGSKPNRPEPVAPTQINVPCSGVDNDLICKAYAEIFVSSTPRSVQHRQGYQSVKPS